MANSVPLPFAIESGTESASGDRERTRTSSLARLGVGASARVVSLELEDELCAWVRAVGIREGERLTVLRRAIFGGPIHVRTSVGGEFALNRQLAKSILLREDDEPRSAA